MRWVYRLPALFFPVPRYPGTAPGVGAPVPVPGALLLLDSGSGMRAGVRRFRRR